MTSRAATIPPPGGTCCRILELRQYILEPGQRDVMIEIFDRCFIESQEELGIRVVGQFRVRGQPDLFAWIRGFPDMSSRTRSLEAFYGESAAWRRNKDAANATMIDFSNVLLLKPAGRSPGFVLDPADRPGPDALEAEGGMIVAEIYPSDRPVSEEVVTEYESEVIPTRRRSGIVPLALLVTEPSVNTFPRLPVREGEHVFVSFSACPAGAARITAPRFAAAGLGEPQVLELEPTRRSLLRAK
jgi:hypothetical protein